MDGNSLYSKERPGPDKKPRESFGSIEVFNLSSDTISVPEHWFIFACWKLQYSDCSSLCAGAGARSTKNQSAHPIGYSRVHFGVWAKRQSWKFRWGEFINQEWCDTSKENALGRREGCAAGKPAANSPHPNGDEIWENGRPESSTSPAEGVPCWRGRSRGRAAVAAGTSSRPELPTLADEAGTRLQQRGRGDANEAELICIYYRATPRGSHNHRAGK